MKGRLQSALLAVAGAASLMSHAAAAADELVDASDPNKLVTLIQDLGYRADLRSDEVGDPLIKSSVGGTQFAIVFYGCDEAHHDGCDFLLFKVGYDMDDGVPVDVINRWNAKQLVGRAYRDDVDDPWLEMALNLKGGVSGSNFASTFEWWEASVGEFQTQIGF